MPYTQNCRKRPYLRLLWVLEKRSNLLNNACKNRLLLNVPKSRRKKILKMSFFMGFQKHQREEKEKEDRARKVQQIRVDKTQVRVNSFVLKLNACPQPCSSSAKRRSTRNILSSKPRKKQRRRPENLYLRFRRRKEDRRHKSSNKNRLNNSRKLAKSLIAAVNKCSIEMNKRVKEAFDCLPSLTLPSVAFVHSHCIQSTIAAKYVPKGTRRMIRLIRTDFAVVSLVS